MVLSFIVIENMEEKHNVALFVSGVVNKEKGKLIVVRKIPKV